MVAPLRLPKRPQRFSASLPRLPMHAPDYDHSDQSLLHTTAPSHSSSTPFPTLRRDLLVAAAAVFLLVVILVVKAPARIESIPRIRPAYTAVRHGVSIVASCSNRHPMLREALASWIAVESAAEILIVDWSSAPPLHPLVSNILKSANVSSPPLRIVRVEDESAWVLSRAYNLAFSRATYDVVFKVDCDYVLSPEAIVSHKLSATQPFFYTGYYINARDANEMHLNGALLVSQRNFWNVGGYDERIRTYGYDDEDLYRRLVSTGLKRRNVSYDHVSHIGHEDASRAQEGVKFPRAQIDLNSLVLEQLNDPWTSRSRGSVYEPIDDNKSRLVATYVPPDLFTLVGDDEIEETWRTALGRRLRDDFEIPWGVIGCMKTKMLERLLKNMNDRKARANVDEVINRNVRPRVIMIHVQSGLGNRLRVMGSGLAFAAATNREPIVIWEKDVHFGGLFSDIFNESTAPFAVVDRFKVKWPLASYKSYEAVWDSFDFYNYMLKEEVGKEILNNASKHMYFKSSAIMQSDATSWESENEQIRSLQVCTDIEALAAATYNKGMQNVGGVHIRNRGLDNDIPGVENNRDLYNKEDAQLLDKWRATTKYTSFVDEMSMLLRNNTVNRFFIASDTVEVLKILEDKFSNETILYIERACDDRGAQCEKFAMADLLVLARSKLLLGSTWSSFTEAAMRLGGPKALMAGTDFGIRPTV